MSSARLMCNILVGGVICAGAHVNAQSISQVVTRESVGALQEASAAMARPVTLELVGVPLRRAIDSISGNAGVRISYDVSLLSRYSNAVTVRANRTPVGKVFDAVLARTDLHVVAMPDGHLAVVQGRKTATVMVQGVLTGKVIHAKTGQPVKNVTVVVDEGTPVAVDGEGRFRVSVSPGEHRIVMRAVGFVRKVQTVVIEDGKTVSIAVELEPNASVLDEVVVTGTVVATKRRAVTTPISVITAKDIEKRGITRIDELLRGQVPGVIALDIGSAAYQDVDPVLGNVNLGRMERSEVYVRGASSYDTREGSSTTPLKTYVDGVEIVDPSYLGTIDPSSIEKIEIVTGPQAATVYGSGALGGVMQIFTKKGHSSSSIDGTLNSKYGALQNNLSSGLTPRHSHVLSITGGSGPSLSYASTVSYNYTGQWQPGLFVRTIGGSIGAMHQRGVVTFNASVSTSAGRNGTGSGSGGYWIGRNNPTGEYTRLGSAVGETYRTSTSNSQTASLAIDLRSSPVWSHTLGLGRSITEFRLTPSAPTVINPADTLFVTGTTNGTRSTVRYNGTVLISPAAWLSSSITYGVDGAFGNNVSTSGCVAERSSSGFIDCNGFSAYIVFPMRVSRPVDSRSRGGFGSIRFGFFERLYLTAGVRGEANPAYGANRKVDWTPTNGIAYTIEMGSVTAKLMGSYGRATRAPKPEQRNEIVRYQTNSDVPSYISQFANDELRPEYSRGPQGGVEVYVGSRGSFTINRFDQKVTDLIQRAVVDSFQYTYIPTGREYWTRQLQYLNVGEIRQQGWELSGSANYGAFSIQGAYSWFDSRITKFEPSQAHLYDAINTGFRVPTHTGNVIVSWALGGTSITAATNYIGEMRLEGGELVDLISYARLKYYLARANGGGVQFRRPGYTKTDINMLHRWSHAASLTLTIKNAAGTYASDVSHREAVLGRQTQVGVLLRFR